MKIFLYDNSFPPKKLNYFFVNDVSTTAYCQLKIMKSNFVFDVYILIKNHWKSFKKSFNKMVHVFVYIQQI